jgi:hypothetical protein
VWAAAEAVGDARALKTIAIPSLDRLCGKNAEGVQGRMYSEAGVFYCRWY